MRAVGQKGSWRQGVLMLDQMMFGNVFCNETFLPIDFFSGA